MSNGMDAMSREEREELRSRQFSEPYCVLVSRSRECWDDGICAVYGPYVRAGAEIAEKIMSRAGYLVEAVKIKAEIGLTDLAKMVD
jgi:hypothetical protein